MQLELTRKNDAFHFEVQNENGHLVSIDAGPGIGGQDLGFRSMELLLAGLSGCSSIDILLILKKQRQIVEDYRVVIEGERATDQVPAVFTHIHLKIFLKGKIDSDKAEKAVKLAIEKYCSVANMLQKTARITWNLYINT